MAELHELSAAELAAAFRSLSLSPLEVTEAVLARIEAWEPAINALYLLHADAAREAAREAGLRWREGRPRSPLDGVPITIKENVYTRGDPAPLGTRATALDPRSDDAPPAARSREAGAVILGKTTMPDFGMLSSGLSSFHGVTRNPWRLDRNPAGSSSGAAAAAAAGYGPLHIGTDIGGSIRLPASACGVFGLKPSLGRIPIDPPYMGRAAGPITRTVLDAAMLLNELARPDPRDFMALPPAGGGVDQGAERRIDYTLGLDGLRLRGLRIGLLTDMGCGTPVESAVVAAVRDAAAALEGAGAVVEPMDSFLAPAMLDGFQRFFEARSCGDILAMPPQLRETILPFIVEWATWRAGSFTGLDVMAAYAQIQSMREAAVRAVGRYDFVLSATSPVTPYAADLPCPGGDPHRALEHIAFTVAYNMSEQPAASLAWTTTEDGLPIGIQVVGQRFDDAGVLRLSYALEQLRPPLPPWPYAPGA